MRIILLLILTLLVKDGFSNAISLNKNLYAIHYGLQNGLPTTNIYDLAQDQNGYLYLGTGKGLLRYDGFSFKSMNENIENYMGGSSISIYNKDHVFFESFDGYVYRYHQKKWKSLNVNKPVHFLNYGIFKDTLFVVQKQGLDVYNISQSKLLRTVKFQVGSPQYSKQVGANYYVINENKLIKLTSKSLVKAININFLSEVKTIRQIYYHDNRLYIVGRSNYKEGVWVFDLNLNYLHSISIHEVEGLIQHIDFIDDKVWIASNKGIYVYKNLYTNWKFTEILFAGENISRVLKGKDNEYWISVIGKGLYMVPNPKQFVYSFPKEKITRFINDNDDYLAGTSLGNIYRLRQNLSSASFVLQNPMQTPINYIYQNSYLNDLFYVPSLGFHHLHNAKDKFYDLALKSVAEIDHKYYALATSSHLLLYPKPNNKNLRPSLWDSCYTKFKDTNGFASLMDGLRSKDVRYDSLSHKLYVLTNVGVFVIDKYGNKEELLVNKNPIVAEVISLHKQNLFYLTYSGDVYVYHAGKSKKLKINSRVLDFKLFGSSLVLKTTSGFAIHDVIKNQYEYLNFKCDPDIISDFYLNKENLTILMTSGITTVPIKPRILNHNFPQFIIENITIGDQLYYTSTIPYSLLHNINSLEINYAILDYTYSASYTLYYKINDEEWKSLPSNSRTLQFHKLSAGDYRINFKINDTVLDSSVHFTITPPYWQTWWFYLITSLSIVIILTFYFRSRRRKLQTQIKLLEEKIQLEKQLAQSLLTSIKAQMNPHFYFNALNSIQAFIYKNDKEHALEYLSKFSKLTRKILAQTEADRILLEEEIEMLKLYLDLEQVRFGNKFSYKIEYPTEVDKQSIRIPAMLIQPYVENAVKHGFNKLSRNGHIKILFSLENKLLKVIVEDNGIGRAQANAFKKTYNESSFSTNANQKRLEILNKDFGNTLNVIYDDLVDDFNQALGTRVTLYIPIS